MSKDYEYNKKAGFDYEFLEKLDAGMELKGYEVKAVKSGRMNLEGSYVIIRGGEAFLINASIAPLQPKNIPSGYDPSRTRRLLLTKKELKYLTGKGQEKGLTLVPIRCYDRKNFVKLEFAIARKKKKHDKRESIKDRETKRKIDQALKS